MRLPHSKALSSCLVFEISSRSHRSIHAFIAFTSSTDSSAMKSLTMRDYDRQQRFADTRPYTPQGYSREHQTPHRSQRDEYEDPERPRKIARYTSPRVQHALPDSYPMTHARATGRPPVTGGAAGQGLKYTTSDYVNTQANARQPVRVVKDSPPHQAVLTVSSSPRSSSFGLI